MKWMKLDKGNKLCLIKKGLVRKKNPDNVKSIAKRDSIVIEAKKGLDIHVPMAEGIDFTKLQGLINIHVHLHQK